MKNVMISTARERIKVMHVAISLAVLCLAATAALLFVRSESSVEKAENQVELAAPHGASVASSGSSVGVTSSTPVSASSPVGPRHQFASLLLAYQAPGSLRKFLLQAVADPSKGASYYALQMIHECRRLAQGTEVLTAPQPQETPGEDGASYMRKIAVFNAWNSRCSDVTAEELDEFSRALSAPSVKAADPLSAAASAFNEARKLGPEQRKEALVEVLATGDPLLIDSLGLRLGLYASEADGPQFYFQGKTYAVRTDPDVMAAVELLPCGLGLRCDSAEGLIGLNCVRGGDCYEGRFDALKNGIMKDDPQRYARTVEIYEKMVDSIKRNAVSDFVT